MAADRRAPLAQWRTRLRWRLAGAWQWPAFFALTAVDAVVLSRLPFAGGRSTLIGSILAAGLLNVIVLAVVPRPGGWLLRRRRPDLPREIAADFAGTAGLVALCLMLVVGGVLHRPALHEDDAALATATSSARAYASHNAPGEYRPLHGEDTWRSGQRLFRTCFEGPDPRRDYCVFVRLDEPNPVVRLDRDQRPNATVAGPGNPGRIGG
ncbi:hypothetical protein [Baekduia sp. Peel2402]|uniref:hypothetical protein n=1 Tax=Baekduia sp. Peel2402 TaxID=3458296 RepID=UPI00403EE576